VHVPCWAPRCRAAAPANCCALPSDFLFCLQRHYRQDYCSGACCAGLLPLASPAACLVAACPLNLLPFVCMCRCTMIPPIGSPQQQPQQLQHRPAAPLPAAQAAASDVCAYTGLVLAACRLCGHSYAALSCAALSCVRSASVACRPILMWFSMTC